MNSSDALFLGNEWEREYVPQLKKMFRGVNTHIILKPIELLGHLKMVCDRLLVTRVVPTQISILKACLAKQGNTKNNPSLNDYAGYVFTLDSNIEIVFIDPLPQIYTVSYGAFITSRFISKVIAPNEWTEPTKFKWEILNKNSVEHFYYKACNAIAIAIDIETFKDPVSIRCIGYTLIFIDKLSGDISTESGVLPMNSIENLEWMRKLNDTQAPKIFQNGKYDNLYLLRYNAPCRNWLYDTAHGMHSWYSELPKDLGFLNAFFLRKVVYWKDLAETSDLHEYYRYNALDTWATANVWIQQLLQQPEWAKRNYLLEFPLVYPCLLSELTGLLRDNDRHVEERQSVIDKEALHYNKLVNMIGCNSFNPGSPVQVKKLMQILGEKNPESSDEAHLKALMYAHPINARILGEILKIRELRKLRTTYLRTDDDITKTSKIGCKEFRRSKDDRDGTILYSLNPHHTDTGRLASRESAFWCGFNIQNIPVGKSVKRTIKAPEGFYIAECDLEQAESRDVAYISGDEVLIGAVTGTRDFHSVNASEFFGIPYADLYDDEKKKTKNKPLRDTSKRTNHGANYNMGPDVLVDTMGLEAVWEAKKLLALPFHIPREITEYLLCKFHITYKTLRGMITIKSEAVRSFLGIPQSPYKLYAPGTYYAYIAEEVKLNKSITSRAFHHTKTRKDIDPKEYIQKGDWTRYCFGNPWVNKLDLNSYAAHPSQSLNARTLNEAYMQIFYEIALPYAEDFRLNASIHDSTLFCYREGRNDLPLKVKELMEIPVTVRNINGRYDTFTVPAALKLGKYSQEDNTKFIFAKFWSETE